MQVLAADADVPEWSLAGPDAVGERPQPGTGDLAVGLLTQPFGCYMMATLRLLPVGVVMGFPDRIERTVELAHPPDTVWAALTTAEGLGAWFGNEAAIDLRPGGTARMRWTGGPAWSVPNRGNGAGSATGCGRPRCGWRSSS
jgi:hypothetical protein